MTEVNSNILDMIGQAVLLVRGSSIIYANPAAAEILGIDCQGKKLAKILGAEIASSQASEFVANAVVNRKSFLVHATQKDGLRVIVLKEPTADCDVMNERFIAAMRSSLMLLSMSAEMCRSRAEKSGDKRILETLAMMNKTIANATRTIANASTVQSIFSGNLSFTPTNIELPMLCETCAGVLKELLPELDIRLDLPKSCILSADSKLMTQLLMNLLSNSIRHGKSRIIDIHVRDNGNQIVLTVRDDGCGISSTELNNVLERYRDNPTLRNMDRGSGFGLTVVRGIAEKHGGTFLLESREGMGVMAHIILKKNLANCSMRSTDRHETDAKDLLIWAADCLPESCYTEKYMD